MFGLMRRSVITQGPDPPVRLTVIWLGQLDTAPVMIGVGVQVGCGLVVVEYHVLEKSPNIPEDGQLLACTFTAYGVPPYNGLIVLVVPEVST